jgi:alkylation response protein AidB-like acyl-CoA dehydrogenase
VRAAWSDDAPPVDRGRWATLAELGVLSVLVPEDRGGLGMDELDLVLLLEEAGRVALPEPIVETAMVAAPLLPQAGEEVVGVRLGADPFVYGAVGADLLLLERQGRLSLVPAADATIAPVRSVDRARRLATVEADGPGVEGDIDLAFERGVLGVSAQLLGVAQHLLDVTVEYAKEREQFGQPIGGFQAIKHHLTNVLLKLEFARPVVHRAAWTVARGPAEERAVHVSMAKAYAVGAAELAAKTAIQVHGAIGYTFEFDLHLWMKRAWALSAQWGDAAWHRRRVRDALLPNGSADG